MWLGLLSSKAGHSSTLKNSELYRGDSQKQREKKKTWHLLFKFNRKNTEMKKPICLCKEVPLQSFLDAFLFC